MGGIKNKLSKLTNNKAKNLLSSLSLTERADERSSSGEVINPSVSLRSTAPLGKVAKMTKRSAPAKGRQVKTVGFQPVGLFNKWSSVTKYIGIACLSLAILSTLVLSIISSYSNSHIESNAEPVTLANGLLVSGPAEISLSLTPIITPTSSQCDTSNSNICMEIPDDGGIATGGHTVKVSSNSVMGYKVTIETPNGNNLTNTNNNNYIIQPTLSNRDNPAILSNNTWGYAVSGLDNFNAEADYISNDQDVLAQTKYASVSETMPADKVLDTLEALNSGTAFPVSANVYYGVNVKNPVELPAGNYTTDIIYTGTVRTPAIPTITNLSQSTYELGGNTGLDANNRLPVTITGTNLKSTYRVYLESNTDSNTNYDLTSNTASISDTQLKITLPTDKTNPDLQPGEYTIHVVTQGGEENTSFTYEESAVNSSSTEYGDDIGRVQVDYDEHMIPIAYTGSTSSPKWVKAEPANTNSNNNLNWYDYTQKKWANAVTVKEGTLETYLNAPVGTEIKNDDVLGYWVYIPRYAYAVRRRDATDKVVSQQDFNIHFETKDDTKKYPQECVSNSKIQSAANMWRNGTPTAGATSTNSNILAVDYQACIGNDEYGAETGTVWATHPAFTLEYTQAVNGVDKTVELNGIWVGKFETTGANTAPTIKPNQVSNNEAGAGLYLTIAKSLGVEDEYNVGGTAISGIQQNSHNLATAKTHMAKDTEWGAVAILASSKYGAGVGRVQPNNAQSDNDYSSDHPNEDYDGDENDTGVTGCGPYSNGSTQSYDVVTKLGRPSRYPTESADACGTNRQRAYYGSLGQLASTTNNWYGVYDMSGGARETTAGSISGTPGKSSTMFTDSPAVEPYVNLYPKSAGFNTAPKAWSVDSSEILYNFDNCTWGICGGAGAHETILYQSIDGEHQMWGAAISDFAYSSGEWNSRGGMADRLPNSDYPWNGDAAGIFAFYPYFGMGVVSVGEATRVVLLTI